MEYLLDELYKKHTKFTDLNNVLFHLAMELITPWRYATPGLTIGVCLLWAILDNVINLNITMHRYREFDELAKALGPKPCFDVKQMCRKDIDNLRLLLESIIQLMELCLLRKNSDLQKFGYPDHFFQMQYQDIESMENWCLSLALQIDQKSKHLEYVSVIDCNWIGVLTPGLSFHSDSGYGRKSANHIAGREEQNSQPY